jgi:hypothetical protein
VSAFAADRHLFVGTVAVLADGAAVGSAFDIAGYGALTLFVFARLRVAIHALLSPQCACGRCSVDRQIAGSNPLQG